MPSTFNVSCVVAVLLAASLLSAAPTERPAVEASGAEAEEEASNLLATWKGLADIAKQHSKEFEDEFQTNVTFLDSYKSSSFPLSCPQSNFSKEACYRRLAEGLLVYKVLLKRVEKEYPSNTLLSATKLYSTVLIQLIKEKMKPGDNVTAPTSSQEAQLLKEFDKPDDSYHRKISAHSVLHHLKKFLADGKRAVYKREKAKSKGEPVSYKVLNR